MRDRLVRLLRAAIGDDEVGAYWKRLTPAGHEVMRLAFVEARELGHPCIAGEHVLFRVFRHDGSQAAALLRAEGLDLETARAELLRIGSPVSRVDPVDALHSLKNRSKPAG